MLNSTLTELSVALRAKKVSAVELTRACLERIGRLNGALNAFITVDEDRALGEARAADARRARGDAAPFTGIPLAHKDIFCTKGMLTTCGSKMLENFVSPYDAHVVERFAAAGSVLLGKCNLDQFGMGSSNENSHFGAVRNPWDQSRVPGGSSGGSAAAVAARMAPAATGTDTGGSTRQPAAFSGICGLRPTYGLVSRYGIIAFASSLDQAGPLAKSAADLALMLDVMAGFDPRDSTSVDRPKEDYSANLKCEIKGLRIGLPKEYFSEGVEPGVRSAVEEAARWFESEGAVRVPLELPNTRLALPVYYVIAPAEASSNLARYDGVRFGLRVPGDSLDELYENTRAAGFGKEVRRRVLIGTYVLSAGYYDAYYLKAQKVRALIANDFTEAFKKVDVVLTPSTPSAAFAAGEKMDDPIAMYLNDVFTVTVNLAGLPGISVPAGLSEDGLPLGLQLIGKAFDEETVLRAAQVLEKSANFTAKPT